MNKSNADPEVWKLYPLTTIEDVRAWQRLNASYETVNSIQRQSYVCSTEETIHEDCSVDSTIQEATPENNAGWAEERRSSQGVYEEGRPTSHTSPATSSASHPFTTSQQETMDPFLSNAQEKNIGYGVEMAVSTQSRRPVLQIPADFDKEFLW